MFYNHVMPHFPSMPDSLQHNELYVLKVTGEGSISVAPDRAVVTLGAITENQNLQVAQSQNTRIISNVIDSLLQLGIPKDNIKTAEYRIDIQYDYQEGKQIFRGYRVTHLLQITIDQIELTGRVVDTAVNNGANSVSNIQFTLKNPEIYYNQALSLAVKDSVLKAMTIAKTLGVRLNKIPIQVQEISPVPEPVPFETTLYAKRADTPIQPGELKVSATVRADYSYLPL